MNSSKGSRSLYFKHIMYFRSKHFTYAIIMRFNDQVLL